MIYLSPVDSAHLIWPHLEASLQRVKDKTGERWTPPFVLRQIQEGKAGLFRFHEDGRHLAYMVVERLEGYEVSLNVWILEGSPGLDKAQALVSLIDNLARSVGARVWKFTGRKGWARLLEGYTRPVATVYEREIL